MIIDTSSKGKIENSLAQLLDISVSKLYDQILGAYLESIDKQGVFTKDIFDETMIHLFATHHPIFNVDEVYVYHLTRRLCSASDDLSARNLKDLLLNPSAIRAFLYQHGISFTEINNHSVLFYNGNKVDLSDVNEPDTLYLRYRLGYDDELDYCFNGFLFYDILPHTDYYMPLSECPEFISILSRYLGNSAIITDYYRSSKYYCYTYKLNINSIIIDGREDLKHDEKVRFIIIQICRRLLEYIMPDLFSLDDFSSIVRTDDNTSVNPDCFVRKEEIML